MNFISLPNFHADVHQALRPALRTEAFVVHQNGKILFANLLAKKKGIKPGMDVLTAKKRSYNLVVLKPNVKQYKNFSKRFYTLLSSFTKTVEPVNTWQAYFGYPPATFSAPEREYVLEKIKSLIENDLEISVRIGSGSNKTIAQLAANISDKSGVVVIPSEIEKEFIQTLPVSMLPGLGKRTGAMLSGMGVQTIKAFAELDSQIVERLFGHTGRILQEVANGKDPRPIEIPQEQKTITRSVPFSKPSTRKEYITTMLHYGLVSAENELNRRSLSANAVCITLEYVSGNTRQKKKTINTTKPLHECLVQIQDALLNKSNEPIAKISIQFSELSPKMNTGYFFDQLAKTVRKSFDHFEIDKKTKASLFPMPNLFSLS